MRKSFLKLTLLFIIITAITDSQNTGKIDGTIWRRMKYENKFYYLMGFYQGLQLSEQQIQENFNQARKKDPFLPKPFFLQKYFQDMDIYNLIPMNKSLKELIAALDLFYLNEHYALIDLPTAIKIILARQSGNIQQADLLTEEALHRIFKNQ